MVDMEQSRAAGLEEQMASVEARVEALGKRCRDAEAVLAELQLRLRQVSGRAVEIGSIVDKEIAEIKATVYEGYRVARALQEDNEWVEMHRGLLIDLQGLVQQLDRLYGKKRSRGR